MQISLELVPRDVENFIVDLKCVKENFQQIGAINIPDLLRFNTRSWDAAVITKDYFDSVIPHVRAIDFNLESPFPLGNFFKQNGIKEILVVKGDLPQDMSHLTYPTSTVKLVKKIKKEVPGIKVYSAIDPYRLGIKEEFDYIQEKLDAGVDGFMTQPFFDTRLLEIYAEKLDGIKIFWGISPVVSEKSKNYWESRNRACFPKDFKATLEWNITFAKNVIDFSKKNNFSVYLMPIRISLKEYLNGIFN